MNKVKVYIIVIMGFLSLSSCKKTFLDVEDNSVILAEQYVKDLVTTEHFINGIYHQLGRDFYHGYLHIYPELSADNIKPRIGSTSLINKYNWTQVASEGGGFENNNELWKSGYRIARYCSFAIDRATEYAAENPSKANQLKTEVLGLRAFVHFMMVNVFAQSYNFSPNASHPGIPYITSFDWKQPVNRVSVKEVYEMIISDLNSAISINSSNGGRSLRFSKIAAKALLSRVYLFKEDWQRAKDLALEISGEVPLLVAPDYPTKLFTLQESEAIFQLSPYAVAVMGGNSLVGGSQFLGRSVNNGNSTLFLSTIDMADLLRQNPNDVRVNWIKTGGIGKDTIVKYPVDVVPGFNPVSNSYYPTLIRSSEMFLTVAEAAAKLGDENTARTYLNAIRQRANPSAANSTVTGSALLDSIYLERRKELCFEGFRMFDLQRWKKGVNRVDINPGSPTTLPYQSEKAISPIPINDVANGIPQNAGY